MRPDGAKLFNAAEAASTSSYEVPQTSALVTPLRYTCWENQSLTDVHHVAIFVDTLALRCAVRGMAELMSAESRRASAE